MTALPGPPILDALDDAALLDRTQSEPSEDQRAQWRLASSRRRKREGAGERVYRIVLNETLVAGALMASHQSPADLTDHNLCEVLLARLVESYLPSVINDCADGELRVDIQRMLRDFDK